MQSDQPNHSFYQKDVSFEDTAWQQMQVLLDEKMPQRKRRLFPFLLWALFALFIGIAVYSIVYSSQRPASEPLTPKVLEPLPKVEKKPVVTRPNAAIVESGSAIAPPKEVVLHSPSSAQQAVVSTASLSTDKLPTLSKAADINRNAPTRTYADPIAFIQAQPVSLLQPPSSVGAATSLPAYKQSFWQKLQIGVGVGVLTGISAPQQVKPTFQAFVNYPISNKWNVSVSGAYRNLAIAFEKSTTSLANEIDRYLNTADYVTDVDQLHFWSLQAGLEYALDTKWKCGAGLAFHRITQYQLSSISEMESGVIDGDLPFQNSVSNQTLSALKTYNASEIPMVLGIHDQSLGAYAKVSYQMSPTLGISAAFHNGFKDLSKWDYFGSDRHEALRIVEVGVQLTL